MSEELSDEDKRRIFKILHEKDQALAERANEALAETPQERLLRKTLEANTKAVAGSVDNLARRVTQLSWAMPLAMILNTAIVMGSLYVKTPFGTLATTGSP